MERQKKRECLKCGKRFESSGPGNRLCPKCNAINEHVRGPIQVPSPGPVNANGEPSGLDYGKAREV